MGAAMLAAYGCGWNDSLEKCVQTFVTYEKTFEPIAENVEKYEQLYSLYKKVYQQTKDLNDSLKWFRK